MHGETHIKLIQVQRFNFSKGNYGNRKAEQIQGTRCAGRNANLTSLQQYTRRILQWRKIKLKNRMKEESVLRTRRQNFVRNYGLPKEL